MLSHILGDTVHIDVEQMKEALDMPFYERWFATASQWVVEHPFYSTAIAAVLGMLVVFALRRVLWNTVKWVASVPLAAVSALFRPVAALWRRRKTRLALGGASRHRLPLVGERALVGPCGKCGTRQEYAVRTTAYYGGQLRGQDTMSGRTVLGCAECARC